MATAPVGKGPLLEVPDIHQHTLLPVHYYMNAIMLLLLHTSFQVNPANTTECLAGAENSGARLCVMRHTYGSEGTILSTVVQGICSLPQRPGGGDFCDPGFVEEAETQRG